MGGQGLGDEGPVKGGVEVVGWRVRKKALFANLSTRTASEGSLSMRVARSSAEQYSSNAISTSLMATGNNKGREYPDSICFRRSDDVFFPISNPCSNTKGSKGLVKGLTSLD